MTYPPEHTTDFDNDEWINGLDREEDAGFWRDPEYFTRQENGSWAYDYKEWTPKQRAEYDYQIDLENGDYE